MTGEVSGAPLNHEDPDRREPAFSLLPSTQQFRESPGRAATEWFCFMSDRVVRCSSNAATWALSGAGRGWAGG